MRVRVACVYFPTPRDLTSFSEACLRFTPEIAVRPERAVFLEIGKCRSLYSEESFRKRMQVMLGRYGDSYLRDARVGIADDATRALVCARYAVEPGAEGALDFAALPFESFHDFADPFGLTNEKNRKPLAAMIRSLGLLGLGSVADFLRVPAAELASRFGAISLHVRSQIENSRGATWPQWAPREVIEETLELAHDDYCTSLEPLLFQTKGALDRVYARLQGRGLRCAGLGLELFLERHSAVRRPVRTFDFEFMMPQGSTRGTLPILQERLDREFAGTPLESAVLRLRLVVRETTPGYQRQQHLFDRRDDLDEAYHSIMAHLAESVGPGQVFRAVVREARLPEKSWKKREREDELHADVETQVAVRPSRLLARPRKIEVTREKIFLKVAGRGRAAAGFKSYTIRSWSKVERISADWLESPVFQAVARNYYQVEIAEGPPLWIYEDEKHEFYLHGWYE
jgi:hypothetical protein